MGKVDIFALFSLLIKKCFFAPTGMAQLGDVLQSEGSLVLGQCLGAGSVPGGDLCERLSIDVSLPLIIPPSPSLKINKETNKYCLKNFKR